MWLVGRFGIIYNINFRRNFYGKKKWYQLWLQFGGKKCQIIDGILGKNGLLQRLIKDVLENILEAEMDEHLGRDKIVYLDAMYFKVRSNGKIVNKAVYICLGYTM